MKAAVFTGTKEIVIKDVELEEINDNEILVEVKACGVCGTDVHIYNGDEGAAKTTPPTILGHEFSGIVSKIGKNINGFEIGDTVTIDPNQYCGKCEWCRDGEGNFCEDMIGYGTNTNGGFAQYCIVDEKQVYKFKDLTFEEAAMNEPLACCLHGIDLCDIQIDDHVTIIGGGMIGQLMVQLSKNAGASQVVLIEPVEEKRNQGLTNGATIALDPTSCNIVEELRKRKINNKCIIECVGLIATMEQAIEIAGKGAKVMLYGLTSPDDILEIKPFQLFQKELSIHTSFINPYTQRRALELLETKTIRVKDLILDPIPLNELNDALADPNRRRAGKLVVDPWK